MPDTYPTNSAGGTKNSNTHNWLFWLWACVFLLLTTIVIDSFYSRADLGLPDEQRDRIETRYKCTDPQRTLVGTHAEFCMQLFGHSDEECALRAERLHCQPYDVIITETNDRLLPDWKVIYIENFYPLEDISPVVEEAYHVAPGKN